MLWSRFGFDRLNATRRLDGVKLCLNGQGGLYNSEARWRDLLAGLGATLSESAVKGTDFVIASSKTPPKIIAQAAKNGVRLLCETQLLHWVRGVELDVLRPLVPEAKRAPFPEAVSIPAGGPFLETYEDTGTKRTEGQVRGGKREGTWTRYLPNGNVQWIAEYENGASHGDTIHFWPDGTKRCTRTFQHGELIANVYTDPSDEPRPSKPLGTKLRPVDHHPMLPCPDDAPPSEREALLLQRLPNEYAEFYRHVPLVDTLPNQRVLEHAFGTAVALMLPRSQFDQTAVDVAPLFVGLGRHRWVRWALENGLKGAPFAAALRRFNGDVDPLDNGANFHAFEELT